MLLPLRVLALIGIAVATHLLVVLIRHMAARFARAPLREHRKLRSLVTVLTSAVVFALYFFVFGLILREFGVSLTAYLASASVLGLAIGFGSQGIVQDVVTGLTLIFSDLIDVGDLVEISGQSGVVRSISMRFVEIENAIGATVFIPNRTINNVVNYPRGYVRCIVDVTLLGDAAARDSAEKTVTRLTEAFHQQFPGILITPPSIEGQRVPASEIQDLAEPRRADRDRLRAGARRDADARQRGLPPVDGRRHLRSRGTAGATAAGVAVAAAIAARRAKRALTGPARQRPLSEAKPRARRGIRLLGASS